VLLGHPLLVDLQQAAAIWPSMKRVFSVLLATLMVLFPQGSGGSKKSVSRGRAALRLVPKQVEMAAKESAKRLIFNCFQSESMAFPLFLISRKNPL